MNLNGDEKRIQQLFREMSRDDQSRVPAFSRVVQGANSRTGATRLGLSRRLALTLATLCVVVITLAIVTVRHQAPVDQIAALPPTTIELPGTPDITSIPPAVIKITPSRAIVAVKRIHRRKPVNDLALAMKLSTWRSPTASLLKTASDDKLMSLPKLGESLQTLRFYSLDDLN